jgi:hypothetical protein
MVDLSIDLQVLGQLEADLKAIVAEFDDADDFSDTVADATGHDQLGHDLHDFAHRWNDKRKKMNSDVKALAESVKSIAENFTKTDTELAKALEGAASSGDKAYPKPATPAKPVVPKNANRSW